MELGATLGYSMSPDANEQLLSISFHPGVLMKSITREELVEWYAEASGRTATNFRAVENLVKPIGPSDESVTNEKGRVAALP